LLGTGLLNPAPVANPSTKCWLFLLSLSALLGLLSTPLDIFNYVMFGFYSTQKGVQILLEMNLQIYFIKEKRILYFFSASSLVLARWPNQPTSPLLPQARVGAALLPSARSKLAARPLFGPAHWPRACVSPRPADTRAPIHRHCRMGPQRQPSPTSRRDGREPSFCSPRRKSSKSARFFPD
jgi:hypothetical protein